MGPAKRELSQRKIFCRAQNHCEKFHCDEFFFGMPKFFFCMTFFSLCPKIFFRRDDKSGKIFSVQKNSTRTNRVSNDIINYYISIRIQSEWVHSSIILASIIYKAQFFLLSGRVSFHLTSVRSHKIHFLINLTLYR